MVAEDGDAPAGSGLSSGTQRARLRTLRLPLWPCRAASPALCQWGFLDGCPKGTWPRSPLCAGTEALTSRDIKLAEIKTGVVIQSKVPPALPCPRARVALPCSRAGTCCSRGGKNHAGLCRLQGHVLHSTSSSRSLISSLLRLVTGSGSQPINPGCRSRGGAVSPPLPGTLSQAQAGAAPESPPGFRGAALPLGLVQLGGAPASCQWESLYPPAPQPCWEFDFAAYKGRMGVGTHSPGLIFPLTTL